MRWYCWLIFFAIACLSTWALPAGDAADEKSLAVVASDNVESMVAENEDLTDDEDEDDEDVMDITSRNHGKPHKGDKSEEKKDDDDEDESSSSEEKHKKHGKKMKKMNCLCFRGKPHWLHSKKRPHRPGKPHHRPSHNQQHGGQGGASSSPRP